MKRVSQKIKLWTLDDFATPEECQELMDLAEAKGYQGSEVQSIKNTSAEPSSGAGSMTTFSRNSYTSFVGSAEICNTFVNKAKKILTDLGAEIEFSEVEGLQVQRYRPGQKYNPHYDTFEDKDSIKQRWWTVMIYLNDPKDLEGGDTYFPNINERVYPKQGRAVIWNNLTSEYCRDTNTLHMGSEVTKGVKYVVTIWFRKPPGSQYICQNKESFRTLLNEEEVDEDFWYWIIGSIGFLILALIFIVYL